MITYTYRKFTLISTLGLIVISLTACGPRILVSTGTTLGMKATPGDGQTRPPPQVSFGYKRAEVAFVPTKVQVATSTVDNKSTEIDAFSTLAAIHFQTEWFGDTELQSFVGTGIAAREILQTQGFSDGFSATTLGKVPAAIQARQKRLVPQWKNLGETKAQGVLELAGYSVVTNKNACSSLQDFILDATTEPQLMRLEAAFNRVEPGDPNDRHIANVKCQ